jgi:hypothetical protein
MDWSLFNVAADRNVSTPGRRGIFKPNMKQDDKILFGTSTVSLKSCRSSAERVSPFMRCGPRKGSAQPHFHINMASAFGWDLIAIMQTRSTFRNLLHGSSGARATMLRGSCAMTCHGRHEGERQTNGFATPNDPMPFFLSMFPAVSSGNAA